MGRRLLFGSKTALARLGIVDGREIFPIRGAEDDDSANSGDGTDDSDNDDSDEDQDDDSDDDGDKPAAKKRGRVRERSSEFNRLRRERNTLLKEKQEREKADREAELKGKSETERAVAERDDAVKAHADLNERYQQVVTELEIIKASSRSKFAWNDIEDVLNDRTLLKAIEIGEDGEISGVEDALKDLAKRKPHFLSKQSDDGDKGKGNNGQNGKQPPQAGTKTGGQPGGNGKGDDRAADRQRLASIYPALQRLPQ